MPQVAFTPNLARHVACPPCEVPGTTVREVLEAVFADRGDVLRGYILDDQNRLRQHIAVFVDGQSIRDRIGMNDPLQPHSEVFIMQALSGG